MLGSEPKRVLGLRDQRLVGANALLTSRRCWDAGEDTPTI